MASKCLFALGAAAVLCMGAPALAQTPANIHHRVHHAHAIHHASAEPGQTRDLNRQQLDVGQPAMAQAPNEVAHSPGMMQQPTAKPMSQRVLGGNPLYSAPGSGGSAHVSGPPVQPH